MAFPSSNQFQPILIGNHKLSQALNNMGANRYSDKDLARGVVTSDILSIDQLSSVSNITDSSDSATFNTTHQTLSWNIENLAVGQSATLTYTAVGTFTSAGTRGLNTDTVSGIDNFTGSQLTSVTAFNATITEKVNSTKR